MLLAVRLALLGKERLSFQVTLTSGAVEAFRVPVFIESLDPPIARFNGELATKALSLEKLGPVFLAVDLALLDVEASGANGDAAADTREAVHVERVLHRVNYFPDDCVPALAAARGKILLVVFLTVQLARLLHKANVNELSAARRVAAAEVVRAERLLQRRDERTSDSHTA